MNLSKTILHVALVLLVFVKTGVAIEIDESFESMQNGSAVTRDSLNALGLSVSWVNGFDDNRVFIDGSDAQHGSNSLKVIFPKDEFGTSGTGAQAPFSLSPKNEYYLSYWLKFDNNFDWGGSSEGGKLPGLAGGDRCSGCKTCTGNNGFSARLMWRTGGKAVLYLYHMDKPSSCGEDHTLKDSLNQDVYFEKGKWYNIIERVKINTGSNYDGEVQLWVNKIEALSLSGLRFVTDGSLIDYFYFSTFHGGSNINWAPSDTSYCWFDNFKVSSDSLDIFPGQVTSTVETTNLKAPHPNPFSSYLNVEGSNGQWFLYDVMGRLVRTGDKTDQLDTSDLEQGIYFFRLVNQKEVFKLEKI